VSRLGARAHAGYGAFLVHRLSGLALTLFLPLHFWALGTAIEGEARLEGFLRWADHPLVRLSELALVVLLAAHLAGGLRLLALEFLPWRDARKTWIALAAGFSLAVGLILARGLFA
jgi:fumarate reductase subunit D